MFDFVCLVFVFVAGVFLGFGFDGEFDDSLVATYLVSFFAGVV